MKNYKITILGCGGSTGVPSIEYGWGNCNKQNAKNMRSRSSIFLEIVDDSSNYNILFDCSPDFRSQALQNHIKHIDSILFTHAHADHIYGIDDLRSINRLIKNHINCYANNDTKNAIYQAFSYIFLSKKPVDFNNISKPLLKFHEINYYKDFIIGNNIKITPTLQTHGKVETVGYIINNKIGYATDFSYLSEQTIELYKNLDLLIVSAFTLKPHIAHMPLNELINLLEILKPKHVILTHMGTAIDYNEVQSILPNYIEPGYDGMIYKLRA